MKQRTILREVSLSGNALHTGEPVTLTIKPAPVGNGIVFRRIDLAGQPEVKPRVDQVIDLVRATTIQSAMRRLPRWNMCSAPCMAAGLTTCLSR